MISSGLVAESDEHKAIRDSVAAIAGKFGPDYFLEASRRDGNVDELWDELGRAGLIGVNIPEEFGGGGGGMGESAVVLEELAAHGMPMMVYVVSAVICGSILSLHGSPEQKANWLTGIADGSKKMAFGLTEPNAGSNSHKLQTAARKKGSGWAISGQKYFISAVDQADAILIAARDVDNSTAERSSLSLFLIPLDTPGLTYQRLETVVISPDRQFTVYLDEVTVGPESLIGAAGNGLRLLFDGLNPERIAVAAICAGVGRYALEKASDYARTRQVWSTPIGAHQGLAHPLAEAHVAVQLARMATYRSAELFDTGLPAGESANIAKLAASDASLKALDQAIQTHGGLGLSKEYGLSELWFVTRLMRTAPVSREMVLNFIAQSSLGLPKSY
ncbi:acyl-CoA dehydrogenase family protein [Cumulibacter manganitolerans]|uniref:acyl-CoA dehydrogenase family protein n=1 Tax=Cumulibacter manganitolerans TaxID=1884992 RepID=UPI001E64FA99|nr:acyl-CoA dehydrogenase family protein [Cumulibacter manganitolerans]